MATGAARRQGSGAAAAVAGGTPKAAEVRAPEGFLTSTEACFLTELNDPFTDLKKLSKTDREYLRNRGIAANLSPDQVDFIIAWVAEQGVLWAVAADLDCDSRHIERQLDSPVVCRILDAGAEQNLCKGSIVTRREWDVMVSQVMRAEHYPPAERREAREQYAKARGWYKPDSSGAAVQVNLVVGGTLADG